jgi:hypothetical protein
MNACPAIFITCMTNRRASSAPRSSSRHLAVPRLLGQVQSASRSTVSQPVYRWEDPLPPQPFLKSQTDNHKLAPLPPLYPRSVMAKSKPAPEPPSLPQHQSHRSATDKCKPLHLLPPFHPPRQSLKLAMVKFKPAPLPPPFPPLHQSPKSAMAKSKPAPLPPPFPLLHQSPKSAMDKCKLLPPQSFPLLSSPRSQMARFRLLLHLLHLHLPLVRSSRRSVTDKSRLPMRHRLIAQVPLDQPHSSVREALSRLLGRSLLLLWHCSLLSCRVCRTPLFFPTTLYLGENRTIFSYY